MNKHIDKVAKKYWDKFDKNISKVMTPNISKCIECRKQVASKGITILKKKFGLCEKCCEKALVAYIIQFMSRKK